MPVAPKTKNPVTMETNELVTKMIIGGEKT